MARKKGSSISKDVLGYLQTHEGIPCDVAEMSASLGLSGAQVSGAAQHLARGNLGVQRYERGSYIFRHPKLNKMGMEMTAEQYEGMPAEPNGPAEIGTKLHETWEKWLEAEAESVPVSEPVVTLRVLGTLKETGEVLVLGDNAQGFESGVWALRKLG
jgi:hypothetical protein